MARIAIVGAGTAGLAAAWSLRSLPVDVTVFEKSRGYAGRAATRGRYGVRYDHGANFLRPDSGRVRSLVTEQLPAEDLVAIDGEVWTLDGDGRLHGPNGASGADAETGSRPMWTYRDGISTIGKRLARAASATVHTQTRIASLARASGGWMLRTEDGETAGPFAAVLLTPPAPQTARLLRNSDEDLDDLCAGLDAAAYASQFTVVLGYDRPVQRPGSCYGVRVTADDHPLAWMGFEEAKPGHVPDEQCVLIVQTAPAWTAQRVDQDPDELMPEIKQTAAEALNVNLSRPSWYDTQRWRYSLPVHGADGAKLKRGAAAGLFFAGDSVAGTGRIGASIESGLDAADRMKAALDEPPRPADPASG